MQTFCAICGSNTNCWLRLRRRLHGAIRPACTYLGDLAALVFSSGRGQG
jgi:hypothetical protein